MQDTPKPTTIRPGIYRHYKGGLYWVSGLSRHTETGEWLVNYHEPSNLDAAWSRPASMWFDIVQHEGKSRTRFEAMMMPLMDEIPLTKLSDYRGH